MVANFLNFNFVIQTNVDWNNILLTTLWWEKEMATHSSVLVWRIPGTEEPSGLLSMGSHRVGHD